MRVQVDVWLRGQDVATTRTLEGAWRDPREWTVEDVRAILEGMLATMYRAKHPEETSRSVALRGLSWIVNPYEEGGVVIAIEITMGAAVAGPFEIDQRSLESMIAAAMTTPDALPPSSDAIH